MQLRLQNIRWSASVYGSMSGRRRTTGMGALRTPLPCVHFWPKADHPLLNGRLKFQPSPMIGGKALLIVQLRGTMSLLGKLGDCHEPVAFNL